MSQTIKNLEAAFASESQAHTKYRYFAKLAREQGFEEIAQHFEHIADQELLHSWGHLELLIGKPTTKECLEFAVQRETHESTVTYPTIQNEAVAERFTHGILSAQENIQESKEHAAEFAAVLDKAEKRFNALKGVKKRHAAACESKLETL